MREAKSIRKLPTSDPGREFAELRQEGLALLAKITGGEWTNFNEGDPGVTLLEELCYALTDLSYRTSRPIDDLLADPDGQVPLNRLLLYPPSQILPGNPITEDDYRRLLLDRFDNVLDASISPDDGGQIPGCYKVVVFVARSLEVEEKQALQARIFTELNRYRNLCERFGPIEIVASQPLSFSAEISIRDNFNADETIYAMLRRLHERLAPPVRFRSLAELLASGTTIDDAYTGPLLDHGFLLAEDLPNSIPPAELKAQIAATILSTPGVSDLVSGPADTPTFAGVPSGHRMTLSTDHNAWGGLCINRGDGQKRTFFVLNPEKLRRQIDAMPSRIYPVSQPDPKEVPAQPADSATYYSIQNSLPAIYRLGANAVDPSADPAQRGRARQLKGYLLTFEQILCNFLAQLSHLGDLFTAEPQQRTYFVQPLYSVPEVWPLLDGFPLDKVKLDKQGARQFRREFKEDPSNPYVRGLARATETRLVFLERRTRFLDHLLARFGESLPGERDDDLTYETIANKEDYLSAYPGLSRARANGFDYTREPRASRIEETQEFSQSQGRKQATLVEKLKILLKKDADDLPSLIALFENPYKDSRRLAAAVKVFVMQSDVPRIEVIRMQSTGFRVVVRLRDNDAQIPLIVRNVFQEENAAQAFKSNLAANIRAYQADVASDIYLVETLLLAPPPSDLAVPDDFFNFHAFFVMTNWTAANRTPDFEAYVRRMIDENTPAHIRSTALWLNPQEMTTFRRYYHEWERELSQEAAKPATQPVAFPRKATERLLRFLLRCES